MSKTIVVCDSLIQPVTKLFSPSECTTSLYILVVQTNRNATGLFHEPCVYGMMLSSGS